MNPTPRPGQPGPGAGQPGQAQAGQPRQIQLLRPETIERISWLSAEDKAKYAQGLRQLWAALDSLPKDSADFSATQQRIANFSRSLIQRNAQHMREAQARKHAAGIAPAPPGNANDSSATATGQTGSGAAVGNDASANAALSSANTGPAGSSATPQTGQAQPQKMPEHIVKHVNTITFHIPPAVASKGPVEAKKFLEGLKKAYASALWRMDQARQATNRIDAAIKDRQEKGNPFTPEEMRTLQVRKEAEQKKHEDAHKVVEQLRRQQETLSKQKQAQGQAQGQNGGAKVAPASQPTVQGGNAGAAVPGASGGGAGGAGAGGAGAGAGGAGAGGTALQNSQAVTATVNSAIENAKNQAQQGVGHAPQQRPGQGPAVQPKPAQGPTAATASNPTSQPQAAAALKAEGAHPPPVNTQIASAAAMNQHPSAGTPTQNSARVQTPVSAATPVTAGARPLTMANAIAMASSRVPPTGSAPMPGQPSNSTPSSGGGVIGSAPNHTQQGHIHAHPTQNPAPGIPPKMPIPKNLPENSTKPPAPVSVTHQARPTLSGGTGTPAGAMGQPANPRVTAYTHQDEGEHVLSKKKLDDLVRQVCGGTAEGQESNLLSPDVEENMLLLADNFMDNVLTVACKNAKERGSKVLEIRDIQLVLERTYNIRVPGYSSDELRTVRKVQPNAAWIAKMSAVQAAKVMPGKGD